MSPSYDFRENGSDEETLSATCHHLQRAPASPFVQNAVVLRHVSRGRLTLIGRLMRTVTPVGSESRLIADEKDYVTTLRGAFALDLPEAARLWPKILARHEEIEAAKATTKG